MSAPKYSAEFTEQVVPGVVQKSRPIAEVARSYGLVAQTVGNWVAKWWKEHPEPGADGTTAEEHAEIRRLKAELREARMEAEPLEESGGPRSPRSPGEHQIPLHQPRGRQLPGPLHVPVGESIQVRLLRVAKPTQVLNGPAEGRPDGHHQSNLRRVRADLRLPPNPRRAGPKPNPGPTWHGPQNHGSRRSRCLSALETSQDDHPCPRPSRPARPAEKGLHRHRSRHGMGGRHHVHPDLAQIRLPRGGHGLLQPEDHRAHESPVTCAPDSSPKPWPWPCETAHQPAVSLSFTQTEAPNTRRPNTRNS